MGKWGARETLMTVGAVILALSIAYYVGKNTGRTEEKLAVNAVQIRTQDSVVSKDSLKTGTTTKRSDVLIASRAVLRNKIVISHDSIFLHDTVIVNHEIAQIITKDDTLPPALVSERAARATESAALRATIALRDTRIKLLESRGDSRISHGIQIGVGYCATPNGNTPCIYAGYGVQVRLP